MSEASERLEQLKSRLLQTEILCQCPDLVNQNASDYISGLMRSWYSIDNEGQFIPTDQTPLRTQDFKAMDVSEIGDYLRLTHPYLFKQSAATGVSNAVTKEAPPPALNRAEMSVAERAAYIRQHGESAYLSLPASSTEAKPLAERRRSEMSIEERTRLIRELGQQAYLNLPA